MVEVIAFFTVFIFGILIFFACSEASLGNSEFLRILIACGITSVLVLAFESWRFNVIHDETLIEHNLAEWEIDPKTAEKSLKFFDKKCEH